MAMFGRGRREQHGGSPSPEALQHSIDEGFLIAKAAITIAVANRIITNALRDQAHFDQGVFAAATREEIRHMIREQREDAERMRTILARAQKQRGRSRHQHDYRRGDESKLRTREATYSGLADRLERCLDDPGFVDGIVLTARARAWDDIGTAVVGRLGWAQRPEAGYEIGRDERVAEFLANDFAALLAEHPLRDADGGGEGTS